MKKQVHYAYLDDMKKYIQGYYDAHLPVDLTAWARVNEPNDSLIYKGGFSDQVYFICNIISVLLFPTYEEKEENPPMVISTHISKSVKLPVYQINLKKYVIEMVLRNNFYDWKISIKSEKTLDFDYMGLFKPYRKISEHSCEGFPKNKVYGSYTQSKSEFTIEIVSNYNLYTFMFLLRNYLGIGKEE